jgi:uncharacterized membrane protein YfcA
MTIIAFTAVLIAASVFAGMLGALTGLGGGVILVPLLVLAFNVDIHHAAGASLISVISTSSGAAVPYIRSRLCNLRIGMFLEMATTVGAILGACLAASLPGSIIAVVFGVILLHSAYMSLKGQEKGKVEVKSDPIAKLLKLNGSFPGEHGEIGYSVHHVPAGFGLMFIAGGLSGLLGIGSGAVKVLAMDQVMGLPFKVSTTTSTFMIGVTAAASAGVYFKRGYIEPGLAMPVIFGVLVGSRIGAHVFAMTRTRRLRLIFAIAISLVAAQMIYKGMRGGL